MGYFKPEPYTRLYKAVTDIVKHYRADLEYHDKKAIEESPTIPFIHAASEMGTHLIWLPGPEAYPPKGEQIPYLFHTADRDHILIDKLGIVRAILNSGTNHDFHYWNGSRLTKISIHIAFDLIQNHIIKTREIWRNV